MGIRDRKERRTAMSETFVELSHLYKEYRAKNANVEALNDINLTVGKGEIFGVIGLSGAGKSTLVRCINLLEQPTSGTVLVDGRDMLKLTREELRIRRQKIGMIFQHFNLLEQSTVLDNVCFPLQIRGLSKKEQKEKAMEMLRIVGLEEKLSAYPSQLSGGQKQRVAIARVLANEPDLLLCDEATSALDPQTTRTILELLKEINEKMGITIIIITHEMRVISEICHRVAVLDKGVVKEQGTVEEVFTNPKTAAARRLLLIEQSEKEEEADEA